MNSIINEVVAIYKELLKAKRLLLDITGSIQACLKEEKNLTQEIGIYAQQMPEFKYLHDRAECLKNGIRRICSGEISLEDASITDTYLKELDEALACFNTEAFPSCKCENNCCSCGDNCGNKNEMSPVAEAHVATEADAKAPGETVKVTVEIPVKFLQK